jgi:predicted O-linked N-acetylglucosamine transferase (SPINDLY family)
VLKQLFLAVRRTLKRAPARAREENAAGARLLVENRRAEALAAFERALAADPGFAPAWSNLGLLLWQLRRGDEAVAHFRRAVEIDPDDTGNTVNLGEALRLNGSPEEAVAVLDGEVRRNPSNTRAHAALLQALLEVCAWDDIEREVRLLVKAWERNPAGDWLAHFRPFTALHLPLPPLLTREIAVWNARAVERRARALGGPGRPSPAAPAPRLRIGYLSGDFRDHAVGQLTAGLFERHDRAAFEIFAYSYGRDDGSAVRRRIAAACEHFTEIQDEPFRGTAARIAADNVHILVDLMGWTGRSRPDIAALRPAPLQVSWLGYPGTTGASYFDYLIADPTVLPPADFEWYTERVAWLPHCYLPTDHAQAIAPRVPSRAACGLPERGVVFCSFNQAAKLDREIFGVWMRFLNALPEAVLWLSAAPPGASRALQAAARSHGIDPARVVFAPRVPSKAEHLARHGAADLFLDTHRYNAHTTACDALWAGLPVLTCPGTTFPGRVAASLLGAVGLPELVAPSLADYEQRALALAREPDRRADLRARLEAARATAPLFDIARFTHDLEAIYHAMWAGHAAGQPPAPIAVS